jgi:hypothetical protein
VKYQNQDDTNGVSYSPLALQRWLQVTLPLTALTLLVAWSTYKLYDTSRSGMTTAERLKDVFDGAKARVFAAADKTGAQMEVQGPMGSSSPSTDGFAWRTAGYWSGFFKPSRTHTRWPRQNASELPIHEMGILKSDP